MIGGFWAAHTESIESAFRANRPTLAGPRDGAQAIPAVVAGQLGADAALFGAVWAARDRLIADPTRLGV